MGTSRSLQVRVVDVFTTQPFAGNPLGVVLDADGLDDATMQSIARELNLSETTFVLNPTAAEATYRMRIFTPTRELPFAGHPSVGTAFLLAEEGRLPLQGNVTTVRQEIAIGVLPLDVHIENGRPRRVVMTQGQPELGDIYDTPDATSLLAALNLTPAALRDDLPVQTASTGIHSLMVPLRDLDALARVAPDRRALEAVRGSQELSGVYTFNIEEGAVRARFFAPQLGIIEDPATGSAAGALGAYLYAHKAIDRDDDVLRVTVLQGVEMGRPSAIDVEVHGDSASPLEVRVGGSAITMMRGDMRI